MCLFNRLKIHGLSYDFFHLFYELRFVEFFIFYIFSECHIRISWILNFENIFQTVFRYIKHEIDILKRHPGIDVINIRNRRLIMFLSIDQEFIYGCVSRKYSGFFRHFDVVYKEYRKSNQKYTNKYNDECFHGGNLFEDFFE